MNLDSSFEDCIRILKNLSSVQMASKVFILVLVVGCIVTGCLNSLFTKYQDNQCVKNCEDPDPSKHTNYQQPAIQTLQMFIGELGCFIVFYLMYKSNIFGRASFIDNEGYGPVEEEGMPNEQPSSLPFKHSMKFAIPAVCDLLGTTLLNLGLIFIPVSVYQMIRGSLVLFVAFLSVIFLKRKITKLEWISLFIISLGIALVGLSGYNQKSNDDDTSKSSSDASALAVVGILLVIIAEITQASQFVIEEHFLLKQPIIPLQLVYFEGIYGAIIILVVMIVLNVVVGMTVDPKEFVDSPFNLTEGMKQTFSSSQILWASILIMLSIASFNYFGLSLTHCLSATARSTIDSCRTLLVWLLAMIMGWELFYFLQLVGFALLVFGTLCFNGALTPEEWHWVPRSLKSRDLALVTPEST